MATSSLFADWSPFRSMHSCLVAHIQDLFEYWQVKVKMLPLASLVLMGGTILAQDTTFPPFIGVVPRPAEYTVGNNTVCLSTSFRVTYDRDNFPSDLTAAGETLVKVLNATTHRYLSVERGAEFFADGRGCESYVDELVLSAASSTVGSTNLSSIFEDATQPVELRSELERYSLYLGMNNTATLSSDSALGLFRGLATFGQLFYKHEDKLYAPFGPYDIHDKPAFGWRAVLLDTSRHYFSTDVLKRQLDIMALFKLNVFHWHMTDSNSWPLHLDAYPELSRAAYYPSEVYTEADIKDLIRHAGERGIDVVIEIDTPGHTASIAETHSDYVACFEATPWTSKANQPPAGQLRFANETVQDFAAGIFESLSSIVSSKYVGAGGDEINVECMINDKETKDTLEEKRWTLDQALDRFSNKSHDALRRLRKTPTVWQEMVLSHNVTLLQNDTIVYAWRGQEDANAVLDRGFRLVHASSDYFYLDCGLGGWIGMEGGGNSWCDPYKSWARIHSFDPYANVTVAQRHLVLGGQASLWTERVDETNLESIMWPRAAAFSEVFWTPPGQQGYPHSQLDALQRMQDLRYRLVSKGVRATPLQPHWCALRPGQCDLDG